MSENTQKIQPVDLEQLKNYINDTVESVVMAHITPRMRAWKIQEESIFDTLESLQNAISFMQKEFNHKIGGIRSRETRTQNESMTVSSLDDALALANKIRTDKGLPALKLPEQVSGDVESRQSGRGNRIRS